MNKFIIEDGIMKAYLGSERKVIVPDGVRQIGGLAENVKDPVEVAPYDSGAYRAFHSNCDVEEIWLPDSVEIIGFKSLEHCGLIKVLSFSKNTKNFEWNCLWGCYIEKILYRGTVYEFSKLDFTATHSPSFGKVICEDGEIDFSKSCYIDTLYFPGTRKQWEEEPHDEWLDRRVRKVVCSDER